MRAGSKGVYPVVICTLIVSTSYNGCYSRTVYPPEAVSEMIARGKGIHVLLLNGEECAFDEGAQFNPLTQTLEGQVVWSSQPLSEFKKSAKVRFSDSAGYRPSRDSPWQAAIELSKIEKIRVSETGKALPVLTIVAGAFMIFGLYLALLGSVPAPS